MNEEHENGESSAPGVSGLSTGRRLRRANAPGRRDDSGGARDPDRAVSPVSSAPHDAVADPVGRSVESAGPGYRRRPLPGRQHRLPTARPRRLPTTRPRRLPTARPRRLPTARPRRPSRLAPPGSPAGFPGVGGWSWIPAPPLPAPPGCERRTALGLLAAAYWVAPPVLPGASTAPARRVRRGPLPW